MVNKTNKLMKQIIIDKIIYNLVPANEPINHTTEVETPTLYVSAESTDGMFVFGSLFNEGEDTVDKKTASITYNIDEEVQYWDNSEWLLKLRNDISFTEHLPKDFTTEQRLVLQMLLNTVHDKGWL